MLFNVTDQSLLFRWVAFCRSTDRIAFLNEMGAHIDASGASLGTDVGNAFDRWLREIRYAVMSARPDVGTMPAAYREAAIDDWIRLHRY